MPVVAQDRPINALREEAIDQLIMNYGHGKLSLEAFERRLDRALDAKSHDEILELTADLDLIADKTYTEKKRAELGLAADDAPPAPVEHIVHVFGGGNRGGSWTVAKEIHMVNVFGGGEIDFTAARFSARETRIKLLCLFGGATFYVPENVNTVSKAVCLFGGIDNRGPSGYDKDAPTLVIDGLVLFGGARVRIKKSLKERWLQFAGAVREMFAPTPDSRPPRRADRMQRTP